MNLPQSQNGWLVCSRFLDVFMFPLSTEYELALPFKLYGLASNSSPNVTTALVETCSNTMLTDFQEYGSGRASMPGGGVQPLDAAGGATLTDYLIFGKLLGEGVGETRRQLELNGLTVAEDERSAALSAQWQSQEIAAYAFFEDLVDANPNSTLQV
jgi:hypothetical protein